MMRIAVGLVLVAGMVADLQISEAPQVKAPACLGIDCVLRPARVLPIVQDQEQKADTPRKGFQFMAPNHWNPYQPVA